MSTKPFFPPAWIVDLDGTLALGRFDEPGRRGPFDWSRVGEDDPNIPVIVTVQALCDGPGHHILIVSGRSDACFGETGVWLHDHGIPCSRLFMRKDGDYRPDAEVKREIYDAHIRGVWDIRGVFDDRNSVVEMWRDLGLACFQVAPGDF